MRDLGCTLFIQETCDMNDALNTGNHEHDLPATPGFASRLALLLDARGYPDESSLRIKQLALDLGIPNAQASKLSCSEFPPSRMILKLARILNTSADYLLGLSDCFDAVPLFADDAALIQWLWQPLADEHAHFDVPCPPSWKVGGELKGLWANRYMLPHGHGMELVVYDKSQLACCDGGTFLLELDGVMQIRMVEQLQGRFARLWFNERGIHTVVNLDRFRQSKRAGDHILGRVIARCELGSHILPMVLPESVPTMASDGMTGATS